MAQNTLNPKRVQSLIASLILNTDAEATWILEGYFSLFHFAWTRNLYDVHVYVIRIERVKGRHLHRSTENM